MGGSLWHIDALQPRRQQTATAPETAPIAPAPANPPAPAILRRGWRGAGATGPRSHASLPRWLTNRLVEGYKGCLGLWGGRGAGAARLFCVLQAATVRDQAPARGRPRGVPPVALPSLGRAQRAADVSHHGAGQCAADIEDSVAPRAVARPRVLAAPPLACAHTRPRPDALLRTTVDRHRDSRRPRGRLAEGVAARAHRLPARGRRHAGAVGDGVDAAERANGVRRLFNGVPQHPLARGRGVVPRHAGGRRPGDQRDDVAKCGQVRH
mmetsp:Transcript_43373/g.77641  ORF Transcript_43373/g.77641 Transcript_43373/m.77641 type:complete len:267 (+) Transcript_43373:844-1644(+)